MTQPKIRLTAELIEGFQLTFLTDSLDDPSPTPQCHREWWSMYCSKARNVVIAAPRFHAKTSALTVTATLAALCFRISRNVVIVSDTESQANSFVGSIKAQILGNDALREHFDIAEMVKDTESEFIFKFKDGKWGRVVSRGANQRVRGINYLGVRPDLVMVDDLENDELVENKQRREKLNRWFYGALYPAMSRKGKIRVVGTILHFDSLLAGLMKQDAWFSRKYAAHNDDFSKILWPERFNKEFWQAERKKFNDNGTPDLYSQEYLNEPLSRSNAFFQPMWWRNAIKQEPVGRCKYYVGGDLAISTADRRDFSVFVVGAVDSTGAMFIVDVVRRRMDTFEIIEEMFRLNRLYKPELMIMERGQISHTIMPVIEREQLRRNQYLPLPYPLPVPVNDKKARATPVQDKLRRGGLFFDQEASWWPDFEDELIKFLRAQHDDQVDALAWLCAYENYMELGLTDREAELEDMIEDGTLGVGDGSESGRSRLSGY